MIRTLLNQLITIYDAAAALQPHERKTYKRKANQDALDYFLYGLCDPPEYRVANLRSDCLRTANAAAVSVGHKTRNRRLGSFNLPSNSYSTGATPWPMGPHSNNHIIPPAPAVPANVHHQESVPYSSECQGADIAGLHMDSTIINMVTQTASLIVAQQSPDFVGVRATSADEACTYCQGSGHVEEECRRREYDSKYCEFCHIQGHTFDKCFTLINRTKRGGISKNMDNRSKMRNDGPGQVLMPQRGNFNLGRPNNNNNQWLSSQTNLSNNKNRDIHNPGRPRNDNNGNFNNNQGNNYNNGGGEPPARLPNNQLDIRTNERNSHRGPTHNLGIIRPNNIRPNEGGRANEAVPPLRVERPLVRSNDLGNGGGGGERRNPRKPVVNFGEPLNSQGARRLPAPPSNLFAAPKRSNNQ